MVKRGSGFGCSRGPAQMETISVMHGDSPEAAETPHGAQVLVVLKLKEGSVSSGRERRDRQGLPSAWASPAP